MDTVRAWKDPEYRAELSRQDLAVVADNPAGVVELSDADIDLVGAGSGLLCVTVSAAITITTCVSASQCFCPTVACGSCEIGTRGCC